MILKLKAMLLGVGMSVPHFEWAKMIKGGLVDIYVVSKQRVTYLPV